MMVNFRKKLNGAFALRPQNEIDPLQGRRGGSSYCRRIIEFQYYQESKFLFEMIVKDLIYIEKKKCYRKDISFCHWNNLNCKLIITMPQM